MFEELPLPSMRIEYFEKEAVDKLKEGFGAFKEWWLDIFPNRLYGVDIIDVNDKVLFRVPPLSYKPNLDGLYVSDLMQEAILRNKHIPRTGDHLLNNYLSEVVGADTPKEDIEAWLYIAKTYLGAGVGGATHNESTIVEDDEW